MYTNKRSFIIYKEWIDELINMSSMFTREEAFKTLCKYAFSGIYSAHKDQCVHNFIQKCIPKMQRDFNNYVAYMQKHGLQV